jgi:hypothetical protein
MIGCWAGLGLSKLQMAEHFCQSGLGGAFPGIKMRSHDTNRVYGKARTRSSCTHFPCRGQRSNLNRQTRRLGPCDSAPPPPPQLAQNVYSIFLPTFRIFSSASGNSGADDNFLVNLGRFASTCRWVLQSYRSPGYSNAEMCRPPTALT